MGIEKLTGTYRAVFNEINRLLFSKKTLTYSGFLRLINDAGYEAVNNEGHMKIHRKKDGTLIRYNSGLPVILSNDHRDLPPGKYKEILRIILEEIERY